MGGRGDLTKVRTVEEGALLERQTELPRKPKIWRQWGGQWRVSPDGRRVLGTFETYAGAQLALDNYLRGVQE